MKNLKALLPVTLLFFILAGIISCNKPADSYKVGDAVAAKWSDGNYWTAKITAMDGDKYTIMYDDGTNGSVTKADMKPLAQKSDLKVGDHVWAVWSGNARMYEGTVTELQDAGAIIKWNDGSTPSLAAYNKIAK